MVHSCSIPHSAALVHLASPSVMHVQNRCTCGACVAAQRISPSTPTPVYFSDAFYHNCTKKKNDFHNQNNGLGRRVSQFCTICDKNQPLDQKNGLGRRVSQFCTICDKNQPLNQKKKNEKVMAILVPRWA